LIAKCDPALIESVRRNWPFLRDRRVDAYGPILSRYIGTQNRETAEHQNRETAELRPRNSGTPNANSGTPEPKLNTNQEPRTQKREAFTHAPEWAPHHSTWIAWPHHEPDWPGKLASIPWVYAEIVRILADHEQVDVLCHDAAVVADAQAAISAHAVRRDRVRLHIVPTDRVWLRDSAPTAALDDDGRVVLVNWAFNGWAKYDNWQRDIHVGEAIATITGLPRVEPRLNAADGTSGSGERIVLEGGGIDVNGDG
jgi:agmatine/peptidylarginine deiminase